jgi:DDE family transposase
MLSSTTVYPLFLAWVQAVGVAPHVSGARALASRLSALLLGQSLAPAALMRTLLSPIAVPARQRYKRVARTWTAPWLTPAWLTPLLVRAALALAPASAPLLALDSVRCGGWEVFTIGLVWHRRVLIVGWAVLPYPWPKRRFTPTVCALLRKVGAAWPADAPTPQLVADRGFPSKPFFATLRELGWLFSIRLRASDVVLVAEGGYTVRELLAGTLPEQWTSQPASYGGTAGGTAGHVVIGRGLSVLAWHQRDAGSARARQHRSERRVHDLHGKHPRQRPDGAAQTDPWLVLFTTCPQARGAVRAYRRRWSVEGSYRDAQSGWDGRHGWDLEPTLAQQRTVQRVDGIVGLWALGLLVQCWVGDQVGADAAPKAVRQVVRRWTTTGRLSVWSRGRLALLDQSGDLARWLPQALTTGSALIAAAPPAVAAATRPRKAA